MEEQLDGQAMELAYLWVLGCQIGAGLNDCYQLRSGHSTDWKNDIVTGRGRPIAVIRDKRPALRHEVVRRYSAVPA